MFERMCGGEERRSECCHQAESTRPSVMVEIGRVPPEGRSCRLQTQGMVDLKLRFLPASDPFPNQIKTLQHGGCQTHQWLYPHSTMCCVLQIPHSIRRCLPV